ncbi:MAG: outer membrane lipoprotein carrier protein LolA [Verrucomicrobiae bacterium]|nr:outer membrane lipoprotein carrier protein LolA [Verrucomicrobiae bacterium]
MIALFTIVPAFATWRTVEDAEQRKIESDFERAQRDTRSFKADLRQTLHLADSDRSIVSRGKFYYRAPDSILIRFDQPAGEYTLLRGRDLYVKRRNQPVRHRKLDESAGPAGMFLDLFRSGGNAFQKDFRVEMKREGGELQVRLTPRDADEGAPVEILNRLRLPAYDLQSVRVSQSANDWVQYEFSSPVRDASLPDELFQPPLR